ncbi:hypothetical protein M440DRAFT_1400517 [Trichoderma longibrachiatum ATCC 18648]|uniref:Uncharacterized protein n=1 Tax=Trichoderma longibrachiatum ATCC 18648 TaxID=983965 RepID=A0A2T4C7P0_TRILO|nr:hypothetical protein M440DRAFT_1400517 [Trichoderma longibrachiatum ATCC 18648]
MPCGSSGQRRTVILCHGKRLYLVRRITQCAREPIVLMNPDLFNALTKLPDSRLRSSESIERVRTSL